MVVKDLIVELQKLPANTEVHIYAGKCCDVQPIERVHFQPADADNPAMVVLVDETELTGIPSRCNCSGIASDAGDADELTAEAALPSNPAQVAEILRPRISDKQSRTPFTR
jgi:hypothetical protein